MQLSHILKRISPLQRLALDFFYGPEYAVLHIGLDGDNRGYSYRTLGQVWAEERFISYSYGTKLDFSGLLAFDCTDPFGLYSQAETTLPTVSGIVLKSIPQMEVIKLREAAMAAQKLALAELVDPAIFEQPFSFEEGIVTVELYRSGTNRDDETIPEQIAKQLREKDFKLVERKAEIKPLVTFLCNFRNQASMNRLIEDYASEVVLDGRDDLVEFAKSLNWRIKELAYCGHLSSISPVVERGIKQELRDSKTQLTELTTYIITKPNTANFTKEEQDGLRLSLEELEQALQLIYAQEKDTTWEQEWQRERKERSTTTIDI